MTERTRKLNHREAEIIETMLSRPFPGCDEVREQVSRASVRTIAEYKDNYGSIEFEVKAAPKAEVALRVPVEALAFDVDGVPIEFLLHVVNGVVHELEVVKADGSPIVKHPKASELTVETRDPAPE
jgi:uncharacterized protein DUF6984